MTTRAQKIWDTYRKGYSEALMTPVEDFATYLDKDSRKIIANVIREIVDQVFKSEMIPARALEEFETICEELENLK